MLLDKRVQECGVLEIFLTIKKLKELLRYNMPIRCVSFRCKNTGDPMKGISMHPGFQFLILIKSLDVTYEPANFMISKTGVPKKFRLTTKLPFIYFF